MENTTEKTVLENIKGIRRKKGISQESIAYDLGIDYSTYGKIERRQISLTVDRLAKIANILNVSILELYGFTIKEDSIEPTDRILQLETSNHILQNSLKDKEKIIKLMEAKEQELKNLFYSEV